MKVARPEKGSNAGYSWGLYADELETELDKLRKYAVMIEQMLRRDGAELEHAVALNMLEADDE